MTTNIAEAPVTTPKKPTESASDRANDCRKRWDRLDPVDHYLLQAVCMMWKIRFDGGTSDRGRLTACPRAYEDLVAAGVVLVVPIDVRTIRDGDQQGDTHRVMVTAVGLRLVREAHRGKWLHTAEWREGAP